MRIWIVVVVLDLLGIAWLQVLDSGRLDVYQTGRWWVGGLGGFAIAVGVAGRGVDGGSHFVWCICDVTR
jgi:hypothetical protein